MRWWMYFLWVSQAPIASGRAEVQPSFGVPFYLCIHPLTQNYLISCVFLPCSRKSGYTRLWLSMRATVRGREEGRRAEDTWRLRTNEKHHSLEHTHTDTTWWSIISLYSAWSDRLVHVIMSLWSVVSACSFSFRVSAPLWLDCSRRLPVHAFSLDMTDRLGYGEYCKRDGDTDSEAI